MAQKGYLNEVGTQHLIDRVKELIKDIGHVVQKGVVADVAHLPALSGLKAGWMYEIQAEGQTTADFVEGAGERIAPHSEVMVVDTSTTTTPVLKWAVIGPIFDVSDRLQFGDTFPASPVNNQTFLYMGETTYTYTYDAVTPEGTENPSEEGWYVSDGAGGYELTTDTTVQSGTIYYTRTATEQYVKGVIYKYSTSQSAWIAQSSGDTFVPITNAEIDTMFGL